MWANEQPMHKVKMIDHGAIKKMIKETCITVEAWGVCEMARAILCAQWTNEWSSYVHDNHSHAYFEHGFLSRDFICQLF